MTREFSTLEHVVSRLDASQPVSVRMRAIFGLKAMKTEESIKALEASLKSDPSELVRHEVAYVLGQMKAVGAIACLKEVLDDDTEDVMVRHEAGEALGAIGDISALDILQRYADDGGVAREIQETCILAVERIHDEGGRKNRNNGSKKYDSIDPVIIQQHNTNNTSQLRETLCDTNAPLAKRYRTMFTLRDRGTQEDVEALCEGMVNDKESALFRHEIAYVLGQMTHPAATQALGQVLARADEQPMVRHEAAEALGAIATDEAQQILKRFETDSVQAVRESVAVALDISDYVASDILHYADTLKKQQ